MAVPSLLTVKAGKAFLIPEMFPTTSVSKHVALSSQACHFDLFQSSGKGMEAEVGHLGLCHPLSWVWDAASPAPPSGSGSVILPTTFLWRGF